jgi:hypothetical protein
MCIAMSEMICGEVPRYMLIWHQVGEQNTVVGGYGRRQDAARIMTLTAAALHTANRYCVANNPRQKGGDSTKTASFLLNNVVLEKSMVGGGMKVKIVTIDCSS